MMLMKDKIMVSRKAGHWEGNKWIDDSSDPFPLRVSVLPVPGESTEAESEGRRRKAVISITSRKPLYAISEGRNADLITWEEEVYEVTSVKPYGKGTRLAHYKATAESLKDHASETL